MEGMSFVGITGTMHAHKAIFQLQNNMSFARCPGEPQFHMDNEN